MSLSTTWPLVSIFLGVQQGTVLPSLFSLFSVKFWVLAQMNDMDADANLFAVSSSKVFT